MDFHAKHAPAVYASKMSSLKRGFALWDPHPGLDAIHERLPAVIPGDVGYVAERGAFRRLFNVHLPRGHPKQGPVVPEYFEPLELNMSQLNVSSESVPQTLRSRPRLGASIHFGVSALSELEGHSSKSLIVSTSGGEGAILSCFDEAVRIDAVGKKHYMELFLAHHDSWLACARREDPTINSEDLVLVTGCSRTKSWAMAVFGSNERARKPGQPFRPADSSTEKEPIYGTHVNWGPFDDSSTSSNGSTDTLGVGTLGDGGSYNSPYQHPGFGRTRPLNISSLSLRSEASRFSDSRSSLYSECLGSSTRGGNSGIIRSLSTVSSVYRAANSNLSRPSTSSNDTFRSFTDVNPSVTFNEAGWNDIEPLLHYETDQCTFVRGYRLKKTRFRIKLYAAAGPHELKHNNDEPDTEPTLFQLHGSEGKAPLTTESDHSCGPHEVPGHLVSILDDVLEKSGADVAIVEEGDLIPYIHGRSDISTAELRLTDLGSTPRLTIEYHNGLKVASIAAPTSTKEPLKADAINADNLLTLSRFKDSASFGFPLGAGRRQKSIHSPASSLMAPVATIDVPVEDRLIACLECICLLAVSVVSSQAPIPWTRGICKVEEFRAYAHDRTIGRHNMTVPQYTKHNALSQAVF